VRNSGANNYSGISSYTEGVRYLSSVKLELTGKTFRSKPFRPFSCNLVCRLRSRMGRPLASGSDDKTDQAVEFGCCPSRFTVWTFKIGSISFSTLTGRVLPVAVRTRQSSCGIWALETVAHPIWTFKASWAFSPDRQESCQWRWDNTIKLWNLDTGKLVRNLSGHSEGFFPLPSARMGRTASSSKDNTIKLWWHWKTVYTLSGHSKPVRVVAFSRVRKPSQVRQSKFGTYVQES